MKIKPLALTLVTTLGLFASTIAQADKLDDVIKKGVLRCAVVLDFPPMGSRDATNTPVGFDVDYCADLAKSLGVKAEVVETPFPDRIPALMSGRADVIVGSTSDTLERAKTVGMTVPYFAFEMMVLTRTDSKISKYEDLKGRNVGGPAGTYESLAMEADLKKWNNPKGKFHGFQSLADSVLALSQGQIDGVVVTSTVAVALLKTGKYKNLKIAGKAPYDTDYVSLVAGRNEFGMLNYMNLFVNRQVRSGRYAELFSKWVGGTEAPNLTASGVYR